MTAEGYRAALARLNLGSSLAADLLGVNERTAQRMAAGDREVPGSVERLLWAMERDLDLVDALAHAFGVEISS